MDEPYKPRNPWEGKCIHGVSGAALRGGKLDNPNCSLCRAERRINEAKEADASGQ